MAGKLSVEVLQDFHGENQTHEKKTCYPFAGTSAPIDLGVTMEILHRLLSHGFLKGAFPKKSKCSFFPLTAFRFSSKNLDEN